MPLHTIGYEGLNPETFLALLREHGIETVVDIRGVPFSRKPGFSKQPLAGALRTSGLEYTHIPALGCPKPIRDQIRADGNRARYREAFLEYLKTQDKAITALAALAATSNCALLCFEADFNHCHRLMVAEAVRDASGMGVLHIRVERGGRIANANLELAFG